MYKIFDGKQWHEFSTYEYLINWISQFNRTFLGKYNSFLDRVGINDKDTYFVGCIGPDGKYIGYVPRTNKVLDENDVSIYDKKLILDVLNWSYNPSINQRWNLERYAKRKRHYYNGWRGGIPDTAYPDFRGGPWPYIHSHHSYCYYRTLKTTNEKRQTSAKEFKEFTRGSRGKHLPSSWDDTVRDWRNDGWKSQGKCKHQWEHGVITQEKHRYGKGVYVGQPRRCTMPERQVF